jgi:hypothetical protein
LRPRRLLRGVAVQDGTVAGRGLTGFGPALVTVAVVVGAAVALGASSAHAPLLTALGAVVVVLLCLAFAYPRHTVFLCVLASAVHGGFFLAYRASLFGAPLTLFDLIPELILVAALSLRLRHRPVARDLTLVYSVLALSLLGLIVGVSLGFLRQADLYQIFRVVRLEAALLVLLAATIIAGYIGTWRGAVQSGLYWAGAAIAVEILLSFAFIRLTGRSLWASIGLVDAADVSGALATGSQNAFRDLALNPFTMVPAFCIGAVRLSRSDVAVLALITSASAVSLSRGAWFATIVAALTVIAFRAINKPSTRRGFGPAAVVTAAVAVTVFVVAGGILTVRLQDAFTSQDQSAFFRKAETSAALHALTADPSSAVLGLGTGTVIHHAGLTAFGKVSTPSPFLENNLLSKWKNTSLFAVVAVVLLLFGAFARSWRNAATGATLYSAGLALPALGLSSIFGGTLDSIPFTGPLWILAGTILASKASLSES